MIITIFKFIFAILLLTFGFIALLKQKTYLDPATRKPTTEVEIDGFGRLKTNYPALIFVFFSVFVFIFPSSAFLKFDVNPKSTERTKAYLENLLIIHEENELNIGNLGRKNLLISNNDTIDISFEKIIELSETEKDELLNIINKRDNYIEFMSEVGSSQTPLLFGVPQ